MGMIPSAGATIHLEKSSPLYPCRLSAKDYRSSLLSRNNDHRWARPAKLLTGNWECLNASPLQSMVSVTAYWNPYRLHILMQMAMAMAMAMAMVMMGSERKPSSMPPSQDQAHTMIGECTKLAVSDSENDLLLVRVMSVRVDGRMHDCPEVEI